MHLTDLDMEIADLEREIEGYHIAWRVAAAATSETSNLLLQAIISRRKILCRLMDERSAGILLRCSIFCEWSISISLRLFLSAKYIH